MSCINVDMNFGSILLKLQTYFAPFTHSPVSDAYCCYASYERESIKLLVRDLSECCLSGPEQVWCE